MQKENEWRCTFNMGVECANPLPPCWKCGWNTENLELKKKRLENAVERIDKDALFNFMVNRNSTYHPVF